MKVIIVKVIPDLTAVLIFNFDFDFDLDNLILILEHTNGKSD